MRFLLLLALLSCWGQVPVSDLSSFVALYASQGHQGILVREQEVPPGNYRLVAIMQAHASPVNIFDLYLAIEDSSDGRRWHRRITCNEQRELFTSKPIHFSCGADFIGLRNLVRMELRSGQSPVLAAVVLERLL